MLQAVTQPRCVLSMQLLKCSLSLLASNEANWEVKYPLVRTKICKANIAKSASSKWILKHKFMDIFQPKCKYSCSTDAGRLERC